MHIHLTGGICLYARWQHTISKSREGNQFTSRRVWMGWGHVFRKMSFGPFFLHTGPNSSCHTSASPPPLVPDAHHGGCSVQLKALVNYTIIITSRYVPPGWYGMALGNKAELVHMNSVRNSIHPSFPCSLPPYYANLQTKSFPIRAINIPSFFNSIVCVLL